MGTDTSVIAFRGWVLDYDKMKDVAGDKLDDTDFDDLVYVFRFDYMSGEYALFGYEYAFGYQDGGGDGFDFEEMETPSLSDDTMANHFEQFFGVRVEECIKDGHPTTARNLIKTMFT